MNVTFIYVALLYFGSVLLIRRWFALPWRVAAIFFLLVWAFLFAPLTLHQTELPADHVLTMFPWRPFYGAEQAHNPQLNDLMLQLVPWAHGVRESWKSGEAPLWNPSAGMGYPLLANGQSAALSPLRLLALPLGLAQSFAFEAAIKLLAALTFAFLYVYRRRSLIAAMAAAISFGFCGFMTLWLYWNHSSVVAFLPALFLAIDLLVERASVHRMIFTAAVVAVLLLNGHPESAAHSLLAGGIYALYRFAAQRGWRGVFVFAICVIAGVLLAMPFLLPFLEAIPLSQRYQIVRHEPLFLSVSPQHLVPMALPLFYGTQRDRTIWGPGNTDEIAGYAGAFALVSWFAVLMWRRRTLRWGDPVTFHLAAAPVLIITAMGWPPFAPLLRLIPPFSMAANNRLRFVAAFSLAVLIGEAFHCFFETRRRGPFAAGIIAAAILMALPFLLIPFPTSAALSNALIATIPGLVVLALSVVVLMAGRMSRAAVFLLLAGVVFDLWSLGRPWYTRFDLRAMYPQTPLISELQRRVASCEGPCRVAGIFATMFPNTSAMYGFEDIRAHDPMVIGRSMGALRVYTGYSSDQYFGLLNDASSPFLDLVNVKYVVVAPHERHHASDRLVEVYRGIDGSILENRNARPRFFVAEGGGDLTVLSAKAREFELRVRAERETLVASSQPFYPGWKVITNGRALDVVRVNELFIGFRVPPGEHRVRVQYNPLSFRAGVIIAIITLIGLTACTLRGAGGSPAGPRPARPRD